MIPDFHGSIESVHIHMDDDLVHFLRLPGPLFFSAERMNQQIISSVRYPAGSIIPDAERIATEKCGQKKSLPAEAKPACRTSSARLCISVVQGVDSGAAGE